MQTAFLTLRDEQETVVTTTMDAPRTADTLLADPLCRWVAKFIDLLIATALSRLLPPIGFFAGVTYLLVADGITPGHSVGKRALGLLVFDVQNLPCSVRASILRNAILAAPYAAWYVLGQGWWGVAAIGWAILVAAFTMEGILLAGNPQGLRLGDELAGTVVVARRVTQRA